MAKVLFCWELGGGYAYSEGQAAGARVIAKAGHEVVLALHDLSHAQRLLGDKFRYYQAPVGAPQQHLPNPMTFADVLINLGFGDADALAGRMRAWRNLFEDVKPDIVRCTNAPGALLAARGTRLRSVAIGLGSQVPPATSPLPILRSWAKNADPTRIAARERDLLSAMNRALDTLGAPRLTSVGALYAEADLRELYTYPELDEYGPREGVKYVGSFQPGVGDAPVWPDVPGKRIFAYLQPFPAIGQALQGLAATGQPTLVYMPYATEELKRQYGGGTLRITDKPLDLAKTVTLCDIGMDHGGHNIVASFLQAGKPQLCIPSLFTEKVIAEKLVALGYGMTARLEAAEIGASLDRLLRDTAMAAKTRDYGARIAHLDIRSIARDTVASIDAVAALGPRH